MSIDYKAYEDQQNFRLILKTEIDFESYTPSAQKIEYLAPGSTTAAEWDASVLTGSETDGKIYHDFTAVADAEVPAAGHYRVRAKLTISGKIVYTDPSDWYIGEFE